MRFALAALVSFAILTEWIEAYWPTTIFQVGLFVLVSLCFLGRVSRLPKRLITFPILPLCLAPLWGLLQLLTRHTVYGLETKVAVIRWLTFLAVFLVAVISFADTQTRHWFRGFMLWFAFLVAVFATVQSFTSGGLIFWLFPTGYTDYVMGPIVSRNLYATFIEAILPVALYESLRREHGALLYSGMAAVMYASVIASASRAGAVLASAEIIITIALMWFRGRASKRSVAISVLQVLGLLLLFSAVTGPESVWTRFWLPDPMVGRRVFNIASLHMIAAHPWLGTGLGTWPTVFPGYATADIGAYANQAHNDWLQWTVEGGIPFGMLLVTLFLWCLKPAFHSVWGLGVVAVFLHAAVDYPFSRPALGSWTILIVAMLAARVDLARTETKQEPVH